MEKEWVDFKLVKEAVTMEMVLEHYQINWLRKTGDNLRGKCPIHEAAEGERAFHVSLAKNVFNCFSCKAKGNVLDFVAAKEEVSVREAALKLKEWFGVEEGTPHHKEEKAKKNSQPAVTQDKPKEPAVVNPPLSFQLRLDPAHEYGPSRGLTQETLEYFGAGFCLSKGMFAGRFLIPLHDPAGQLVGYAGRSIDDKEPKYLFPSSEKGFHKSRLVFNLHRVVKVVSADQPVVVVEGFFGCMKVHQAGYPCVGILGSSLSEEQEELLIQNFGRLVCLFDGDGAGWACGEDCVKRLARKVFVKEIWLAEGQEPDRMTEEEIKGLIG